MNISNRTIKSLFIGLFVGIISVFIIHFFGSWSARPPETNSISFTDRIYANDTKVSVYTLLCPLDNIHVFQGQGATFDDVIGGHFSGVKFRAIFYATFDEHWKSTFLIGAITFILINFLRNPNEKSNKESPSSVDQ